MHIFYFCINCTVFILIGLPAKLSFLTSSTNSMISFNHHVYLCTDVYECSSAKQPVDDAIVIVLCLFFGRLNMKLLNMKTTHRCNTQAKMTLVNSTAVSLTALAKPSVDHLSQPPYAPFFDLFRSFLKTVSRWSRYLLFCIQDAFAKDIYFFINNPNHPLLILLFLLDFCYKKKTLL